MAQRCHFYVLKISRDQHTGTKAIVLFKTEVIFSEKLFDILTPWNDKMITYVLIIFSILHAQGLTQTHTRKYTFGCEENKIDIKS